MRDPTYYNVNIVETLIPTYRCPSAGIPDHQYDVSSDSWHVTHRVPGSYLGCASGVVVNQNEPRGLERTDGVLFGHNKGNPGPTVEFRRIRDGLSKTMLVGEAAHDPIGQVTIGRSREQSIGDHKDHWYIGSDDVDVYNDPSECLGSTGVEMNLHQTDLCQVAASDECQASQLSFSSKHPGGAQIVMCDGGVFFKPESIDAIVWRDLGTRDGQTVEASTLE